MTPVWWDLDKGSIRILTQMNTFHITCPPTKVRADRSSSAGPLSVKEAGNTSPVFTFTPEPKRRARQSNVESSGKASARVCHSPTPYTAGLWIRSQTTSFTSNTENDPSEEERDKNRPKQTLKLPVMQQVSRWISSFCFWNAAVK